MDLKLDLEEFLRGVEIGDESEFVCFKDVGNHCCGGQKHGVAGEVCGGIEEEKRIIKKRKKECYLPLLDWVKNVAKDPCDPAIGKMPKSSKWKAYGSEHVWKQVLMAKQTMSLKLDVDSDDKHSWQKKQKMHPDMYNELSKNLYSRCSRVIFSTEEKKRIPVGPYFQAEVPQWSGKTQESESKWLGTRVWPLKQTEYRNTLIEREPIGKGRQGSCGCQLIGSPECVRFHIAGKRARLKLELGSAFVEWKFDMMGEEVSLKWTKNEENMFASIIQSNPVSTGRSFWDLLVTHFKNKTRPVLVSYYFGVYLLRRRAHQNRADPSNVDSDHDELEKVGHAINKSKESILYSPDVHMKFTAAI